MNEHKQLAKQIDLKYIARIDALKPFVGVSVNASEAIEQLEIMRVIFNSMEVGSVTDLSGIEREKYMEQLTLVNESFDDADKLVSELANAFPSARSA